MSRLRICRLEYGTGEVCMEAADEIELLRKDVEFWEKRYWQLVAEVTP